MTNYPYDLQIVSQSPFFHGRVFKPYYLDGVNNIGVHGNEAFSIRFHNHGGEMVQIKIAVDGTDVLTGGKADLTPGRMWVVQPHSHMELKAWPESTRGGAQFVFTTVDNSVALHTHGDLSAKGYLSVAVFTEGYTPPPLNTYMTMGGGDNLRGLEKGGGPESFGGPAVGAGRFVQQNIGSAQGLREPSFQKIHQVRYLWWDDLKAKLDAAGIPAQFPSAGGHPTGFEPTPLANLGNTPRLGTPPPTPSYSRFE